MASKVYTAREMREMADCAEKGENCKDLSAMLRQAADAEEENAQLKARLDAVVKECDNPHWQSWFNRECYAKVMNFKDAILRAARGEGGAE